MSKEVSDGVETESSGQKSGVEEHVGDPKCAFFRTSMIVARTAAKCTYFECRDRLGRLRFVNRKENDAQGRGAKRLYLKFEMPDEFGPPVIRWVTRSPWFSGEPVEPREETVEIKEDEVLGYSTELLKSLSRKFELDIVLEIESELKQLRRYWASLASLCGERLDS